MRVDGLGIHDLVDVVAVVETPVEIGERTGIEVVEAQVGPVRQGRQQIGVSFRNKEWITVVDNRLQLPGRGHLDVEIIAAIQVLVVLKIEIQRHIRHKRGKCPVNHAERWQRLIGGKPPIDPELLNGATHADVQAFVGVANAGSQAIIQVRVGEVAAQ